MPPIDLNSLPDDASALRKIVGELAAQLQHESAEKDKYRSLLRELLEAQRSRKSEQLSKEQLALFEELWKAQQAENESEKAEPDAGGDEGVLDDHALPSTPSRRRRGELEPPRPAQSRRSARVFGPAHADVAKPAIL